MCTLRVSSNRKTLTDFLSVAQIPYYEAHDRETPQKFGRDKGKPHGHAGFKSEVSKRSWEDLQGQISDAIRFLRRYKADLKLLREQFEADDIRLDFPYFLRIGKGNTVAQFDYLPPALIFLAGEAGVGIEMSLYPAPSIPKKRKATAEPGTPPNHRPSRQRAIRALRKGGGR